jgi:hypothetical protein
MDSLTKASGVAVSVLVAATASVLLLLPTHPRLRTSRGAGMTPAVMVSSATARPPAGQPLALGGTAYRCLPPVAPVQDCRVSGDSTGGTRSAVAGSRRCRHGPLAAAQPGGTGRAHSGSASAGRCCPDPGGTGRGGTERGGTGRGTTGWSGAGRAGAATSPWRPAGHPRNCPTRIPRQPR